jgi:hypothetical protein
MTPAGIARVWACFETMVEILPFDDPRDREEGKAIVQSQYLPQMPQLPQQQTAACKTPSDQRDAYEERAAIMEYDAGLPRALAEFLAKKGLQEL